jgi:hypothetical protein
VRRGPYMPDPPTVIRLTLDEQGARILHGIVVDALPAFHAFHAPAAGRVQQIADAHHWTEPQETAA